MTNLNAHSIHNNKTAAMHVAHASPYLLYKGFFCNKVVKLLAKARREKHFIGWGFN